MVTDDKGKNNEKAGTDTNSDDRTENDQVTDPKREKGGENPEEDAASVPETEHAQKKEQATIEKESQDTGQEEKAPGVPVEIPKATEAEEAASQPEQEEPDEALQKPQDAGIAGEDEGSGEAAAEAVEGSTEEEQQKPKEGQDHEEEDSEHEEGHHLDYSNHTKKQMIQVLESLLKEEDMVQVSRILKEIKPAYDELHDAEKEKAFDKYIAEGGEKDGFEYKEDDQDIRFREAYETLRDRKNEHFSGLDKKRNDNLARKQELLERLRKLVDAEETNASIHDVKNIQQEWRQTGPVAPQHMKSLWANYNALIDRYYDQRSIYFELKELDRKKNLKQKLELCDRAEKLNEVENIKDAIRDLNELHEEFKLIGPVPKEDQEPLWQRFKTASDAIYAKRKEHYDQLKEQLNLNLTAKLALVEKVREFKDFDTEKISDWNSKTREILEIQKEWESIGGMPRDKAKEVNKSFWSGFKTFFANKGSFFKRLEEKRKENLVQKEALVAKAEELKDSEDFDKTAEVLKQLQRQWKDIGPVTQKQKDVVYKHFKEACDHFFERRRASHGKIEQDYNQNLEKKQALCEELESMDAEKADPMRIEEIISEYSDTGFVPKNAVKKIQHRFANAAASAVDKTDLSEEEKQKLKFNAQFQKMNFGPGADRFLQKKENTLRRQIAKLENDISLWKNNLDFFADSKQADKVRDEFNKKIDRATKELNGLKQQLTMVNRI